MNQYFSEPLTDRYAMNPSTGEIMDIKSGQVYGDADQLRAGVMGNATPNNSQSSQNQGIAGGLGGLAGLTALAGLGSSGSGASKIPEVIGKAPAMPTVVGSTGLGQIGTGVNGGAVLSDGVIGGTNVVAPAAETGVGGLSGLSAYAAPAAAAIGSAYGLYNGVKNFSDGHRSINDNRNMALTAISPLINGISYGIHKATGLNNRDTANIGLLASGIGAPLAIADMAGIKLWGTKKAEERYARKQDRGTAQDFGLMGSDSRSIYDLGNGDGFDIRDYKKNTGKDAYNIDFNANDPERDLKIGAANALASAITGGDKKRTSDMAGELYNAYNSNGDFWNNIQAAANRGGGIDAWHNAINDRVKGDNKNAYLAGLDSIFNTNSRNTIAASLNKAPTSTAPVRNGGKPAPVKPRTYSNPRFK